jgi:hypothetical protein
MKAPAAWLELSSAVVGLMIAMFVVMWAQRPASTCTLSPEAPRVLMLNRETDREHLATDLASAARIARRYDASAANPAQRPPPFLDCEATLVQQIAIRHGLSPEHVRARAPDAQ